MYLEVLSRLDERKYAVWKQLMESAGLEAEQDLPQTVLLWDADVLAAAGSRQGNLLRCIAVAENRQGENLTATVLTALRQEAFREGHQHLFLYTKPENREIFSGLFFYPVAQTESVLLMENQKDGVRAFLDTLPRGDGGGGVGAAVMNCNPFTLGHRFLIETAAGECRHLYVFIVSEDRSRFSAEDRLEMARLGTADLPNVTVLPTGPYLLSAATFPTYFLKDRENVEAIRCRLDIEVFTRYFAPRFSVTSRYVGTEPTSRMTDRYNAALRESLPGHGIALREIPRLCLDGNPVSASTVRALLDAGDAASAKKLIPETTYRYIKTHNLG